MRHTHNIKQPSSWLLAREPLICEAQIDEDGNSINRSGKMIIRMNKTQK